MERIHIPPKVKLVPIHGHEILCTPTTTYYYAKLYASWMFCTLVHFGMVPKSLLFLHHLDLEMAYLLATDIETTQAIADRAEPSPSRLSGTRRHIQRGTSAFQANNNIFTQYQEHTFPFWLVGRRD